MSKPDLKEEQLLREVIRGLLKKKLKEASADASSPEAPYDITAMNFLKTLLQNIIPKLESSYKSLTTSDVQRKSFRAHVLNGVDDLLKTVDEDPHIPKGSDVDQVEEEIEIDVGDNKEEEEPGFIDISDEPEEPEVEEPDEEELFGKGLEDAGLDNTGRNAAYTAFREVANQIEDAYQKIDSDSVVPAAKVPEIGKDSTERFIFKTYLIKNLQLYFQRFEEELSQTPEEPKVSVQWLGKEEVTSISRSTTIIQSPAS